MTVRRLDPKVVALGATVALLAAVLTPAPAVAAECGDSSTDLAVVIQPSTVEPGGSFTVDLSYYGLEGLALNREQRHDGGYVWVARDLDYSIKPGRPEVRLSFREFPSSFHADEFKIAVSPGGVVPLSLKGAAEAECFARFIADFDRRYWTLELLGRPDFWFDYRKNSQGEYLDAEAVERGQTRLKRLVLTDRLAFRFYQDREEKRYLFSVCQVEKNNLAGRGCDWSGRRVNSPRTPSQTQARERPGGTGGTLRKIYEVEEIAHRVLDDRYHVLTEGTVDEIRRRFPDDPYLNEARLVGKSFEGLDAWSIAHSRIVRMIEETGGLDSLELCTPSCVAAAGQQRSSP